MGMDTTPNLRRILAGDNAGTFATTFSGLQILFLILATTAIADASAGHFVGTSAQSGSQSTSNQFQALGNQINNIMGNIGDGGFAVMVLPRSGNAPASANDGIQLAGFEDVRQVVIRAQNSPTRPLFQFG